MRGRALTLVAGLLVAAVLGVQLAAGGADHAPRPPANPCVQSAVAPIPPQLNALTGEIVLLGLNHAACRLGISRERLILALGGARSLAPGAPAALKAGLIDAVGQLSRQHRLPRVSQLLPQALAQTDLPGIVKTLIEAVPDGVVDNLLPTAPLLQRTIQELDITRLLGQLNDPRQLQSAVRSAILHAAFDQILAGVRP